MKELIEIMTEIVEKNVKNYKSDFYQHDIKHLTQYEEHPYVEYSDKLIWITRESGTFLFSVVEKLLRPDEKVIDNDLITYKQHFNCEAGRLSEYRLKMYYGDSFEVWLIDKKKKTLKSITVKEANDLYKKNI